MATTAAEGAGAGDHAEFIRRIRGGDEHAAEELVRRYEPEIRVEVRGLLRLRNPNLRRVFDSMDICQSVLANFFVRAAVGEFDIEEPSRLVRLLVVMARNKLAEQARHHQRQRRDVRRVGDLAPEQGGRASDATPSRMVSGRELLEQVRGRLSDDERRLADLRATGLDWSSIAARLGGTAEARRKQLSRALARVDQDMGFDSLLR